MQPDTHYAKSGEVRIAYQVFGQGAFDLVYVPGFVSNIDLYWDYPAMAHFLSRLGSFCRVIVFDKRGTGLSDRPSARRRSRSAWTTCAPSWTRSAASGRRSSASPRAAP